jgi:glycosyltransferase involved in cell wall biosynthesis
LKIGVYADPMARVLTSFGPIRGMLKELIENRLDDEFVILIHPETQSSKLLRDWFSTIRTSNWRLRVLRQSRRDKMIRCILGLRSYSKIDESFDLLYSCDLEFHDVSCPQIVQLFDLHPVTNPEFSSIPWHGAILMKRVVKHLSNSDAIVASISQFSVNELSRISPSMSSRSVMVPIGIAGEWFQDAEQCKNVQEICSREYWIWWGQITRRKNLQTLMRAYSKFRSEVCGLAPSVVLVCNGGSDYEKVKQLVVNLGLEQFVHFVPSMDISSLVSLVRSSCGVLFPSLYEGFGLPVIEGMASGKPVLTSGTTSIPEVAGGNAILVDPTSEQDMLAGLHKLAKKDSFIPLHLKQWASRFTYSNSAKCYNNLIDKVYNHSRSVQFQVDDHT